MAQVETPNRATSDPEARKDVLKRIDDEGVEFVLLWFTDIEGHLKSFAVTPSEIEGALDDGMGFDGSSITGFNAIEESDMVAIPDPDTYQLMPWREGETKVGADDLRRRHARRQAVRGRPALRPAPRARADGVDGLRHVQRRPRARVLPLQGRHGHGDARRGRLLRDDDARRGDRAAPARRSARSRRWASRSSTSTTRSGRRSTRSTCASRPRSRWPTTRSPTG